MFSINQLVILIFVCVLIFGDLSKIISNLKVFLKKHRIMGSSKNSRKKGT